MFINKLQPRWPFPKRLRYATPTTLTPQPSAPYPDKFYQKAATQSHYRSNYENLLNWSNNAL